MFSDLSLPIKQIYQYLKSTQHPNTLMERCQNCNKDIEEAKIATHFGYCRRNVIKCKICGEPYDKNFQEEHQQQFHETQECQFCKIKFKKSDLTSHSTKCQMKPKYCQYCDLNVPFKDYEKHLKICQSRTSQCEVCQEAIVNKKFAIHIASCTGKKIVKEPLPRPERQGFSDYNMEDSLSQFSRQVAREKEPQRAFKKEKEKPLEKKEKNSYGMKPKKEEAPKKRQIPSYHKPQPKKESKKVEVKNPEQISRNHFNQNFFPSMDYEDFPDENQFEPYNPYAYQTDFLQESLYRQELQSKLKPSINNDFGDISEEDQLLHQTLLNSSKKTKKNSSKNGISSQIPKQFMSQEIMGSSFYGDILDIEKQKAIQRQFASKESKKASGSLRRR